MKNTRNLFFAAALLLMGAGCAPSSPPASPYAPPVTVPPAGTDTATPPSEEPPTSQTETEPPTAMEKTWAFPGILPENQIANRQIRITTDKGVIIFELFDKDAPKTVSNFIYLAKGGYYDGLTFHRIVPDFVVQGGDPNGNGSGGPGYHFQDELPSKHDYLEGTVAMANSGPDTNGSQFFIDLVDHPPFDGPKYTPFGQVTSGMDVVKQLRQGDVMRSVVVEAKSK